MVPTPSCPSRRQSPPGLMFRSANPFNSMRQVARFGTSTSRPKDMGNSYTLCVIMHQRISSSQVSEPPKYSHLHHLSCGSLASSLAIQIPVSIRSSPKGSYTTTFIIGRVSSFVASSSPITQLSLNLRYLFF